MQLERLTDNCQAVSLGQKTAKEAGNTLSVLREQVVGMEGA